MVGSTQVLGANSSPVSGLSELDRQGAHGRAGRREGRSAARRGSSQVSCGPSRVGEGCGQVLKILTRAS